MVHFKERRHCRDFIVSLMKKEGLTLKQLENDPRIFSKGLRMQFKKMILEKRLKERKKEENH